MIIVPRILEYLRAATCVVLHRARGCIRQKRLMLRTERRDQGEKTVLGLLTKRTR
jgi:hypothetical protein